MEGGHPVKRYQVCASFRDGVIEWSLALETDDGRKHVMVVQDSDDLPLLHRLCHDDATIYYDEKSRILRTGWNVPGKPTNQP